jgi:general secretion pathway protein A
LDREDTTAYVAHRLRVAGAAPDVVFGPEAMDGVFRYSTGIPRLINAVADLAMLAGYVAGSRTILATEVEKALEQLECRV